MGAYIYSVRTSSIETTAGKAYLLAYLTKPHYDWGQVDAYTKRLVGAAHAVWERRGEEPGLVFLPSRDDNKPQDGDPVYRWDGRATDYDEPNFAGIVERAGFLRGRKVGRKTVWVVEPVKYEVSVGTVRTVLHPHLHVRTSACFFHMSLAKAWIKANTQPGEEAMVATYRATTAVSKSALERVAAPSEEAKARMIGRLTTGPWPAYPENPSTLTADERAAADELLAEGKVVLHAEKYEGEDEPPYWHGALHYKATVRMFELPDKLGLRAVLEDKQVVFTGGKYGDHTLDRLSSSPERIQAHWDGYCEAQAQ